MSKINDSTLLSILELSRWAPSAENRQFWRFKIIDSNSFDIYAATDGGIWSTGREYALLHSLGCLLETISIASSHYGLAIESNGVKINNKKYQIHVILKPGTVFDSLYNEIQTRTVNRMFYQKTPILDEAIKKLSDVCLSPYNLVLKTSKKEKKGFSALVAECSKIRYKSDDFILNIADTIDCESETSIDKIPLSSLGLSKLETIFFKNGLTKTGLMKVMNRCLGGASLSAHRLDVLPILNSGGIFYLTDDNTAITDNVLLEQGRIIQRFWLTLQQLGLVMQPTYVVPIMQYYGNELNCKSLADKISILANHKNIFFAGRLGYPLKNSSQKRSLRLPLDTLIVNDE